jgi:hypothetical protein
MCLRYGTFANTGADAVIIFFPNSVFVEAIRVCLHSEVLQVLKVPCNAFLPEDNQGLSNSWLFFFGKTAGMVFKTSLAIQNCRKRETT